MKKNILKIIMLSAVLLILAGSFASCKDNDKELKTYLSGMYIQTYPEYIDEFRIKINFIDNTRLKIIKSATDDRFTDEFIYSIQDSTIKLTSVANNPEIITEHYFRIIDSRKFEIGNLNAHIPEVTPPNMIFEKEN